MGIIAERHPRLPRLQGERSPNPARLSSSGRDDPTSKYLHKSRCGPHAAPAILLANLGAGISPRGGSAPGGRSGHRVEERGLPGSRRDTSHGPGPGHVPVSRHGRGRLGSSVSHAPAASPESFGGWFLEILSLEGREFPALFLRGNPPPAPGSSFSPFFLSFHTPPPHPPFWTEFLADSTALANRGFYRKSLHSPRRRGVMGLGQS